MQQCLWGSERMNGPRAALAAKQQQPQAERMLKFMSQGPLKSNQLKNESNRGCGVEAKLRGLFVNPEFRELRLNTPAHHGGKQNVGSGHTNSPVSMGTVIRTWQAEAGETGVKANLLFSPIFLEESLCNYIN